MARFLIALTAAVIAGYFTIKLLISALGQAYEMIGTVAGLGVTVLVFWFAWQELMKGYHKRKAGEGGAAAGGSSAQAKQPDKSKESKG